MTKTGWGVWLVFAMLVVALPALAGVSDCTSQPDGTPCDDTDGDVCTMAACDGAGMCVQTHTSTPQGTSCPELDDNVCTMAFCNGRGDCNQSSGRTEAGTECPDTDGQASTHAACDGVGNCDQSFIVNPTTSVPALSVLGMACVAAMLMALGFWQVRRRSLR